MRYLVHFCIFSLITCFACKNNPTSTSNEESKVTQVNDKPVSDNKKTIIFFGNSLTAGYGLDEDQSFPSLIQKKIDSLNLPYKIVNAGLSGETTADGKNRIHWILKQPVDIFVLELGANDVLRGQDLAQTENNLRDILKALLQKYPNVKIVIAGMQAPNNMGNLYTKKFASIFPKLSKEYNATLIPFLLKDVATISSLNLQDGKHPNAEGQKIVAKNVWEVLEKIL